MKQLFGYEQVAKADDFIRLTGIEAAVVLGAVAGAPSLNMEVLSKVNDSGETISCVGQIGKEGMKETDKEILRIMLERV